MIFHKASDFSGLKIVREQSVSTISLAIETRPVRLECFQDEECDGGKLNVHTLQGEQDGCPTQREPAGNLAFRKNANMWREVVELGNFR